MGSFRPKYNRKHSSARKAFNDRRYKDASSYFVTKPKNDKRRKYRSYYQRHPSAMAYVEEPETDEFASSESESSDESSDVSESDSDISSSSDSDISSESSSSDDYSSESSSSDEESYEFDLHNFHDDYPYSSDEMGDLNDELETEAVDQLERDGRVYDLNNDALRYYDQFYDTDESESSSSSSSESSSESSSDSDLSSMSEDVSSSDSSDSSSSSDSSDSESEYYFEPADILDIVDMNDQLQAEALRDIQDSSDAEYDSDESSVTDIDIPYYSNESDLEDQLQLENIRQNFEDGLESNSELEVDSEDSTDFIEVERASDFGDMEIDSQSDFGYDSESSSDDEGMTIYRHRFDLPNGESEDDSTDEELMDYIENENDHLFLANDSDDYDEDDHERQIIDLTKDLENSKDCELVDINDNLHKLILRIPAILNDQLKIKFNKRENKLTVCGKIDIREDSDSDVSYESDEESVEEEKEEEKEEEEESSSSSSSESESSSSSSNESSSSESSSDSSESEESEKSEDKPEESPEESSEKESSEKEADKEESSDSESSDDDAEIAEDTKLIIQDYINNEIEFEKVFMFDKVIKFDEIKAKVINGCELEITIPNEDEGVSNSDIQIDIEAVDEKEDN